MDSPAIVYRTNDATLAHSLAVGLRGQGLWSEVVGDQMQNIMVGGMPGLGWTEVVVRPEDAARALELIRAWTTHTEAPPPEAGEPWTCAACDETNDGVYALCWSCSSPRPA